MTADCGSRSKTDIGECISPIWFRIAVVSIAICGFNSAASAQAVYGSIFGTVTDASGAAVPNATITVTDISKGTSTTTQTGPSGEYRAEHLIPDSYKVQAAAQGFQAAVANNVVVYADTAPKIDLHLTVGGTTTTVEVTSAAPLLQTDRADVSTVLNARAVEQLPNLNRNFTAFELLTPGTTYIGWSVGQSNNPQQSEQIEVNGQLPFATGYQLDGTDNQDPIYGIAVINPNLDAISEMKVTSQNYDAEQGNAVAGMVTAQTKSGSNAIHGSAFEYRRSDAQQARDPFSQSLRNSTTRRYIPSTLHNQFGGSVGLPIKKDKIFAFGDYQGLREKTGTAVLTTVPTALAKSTCTSGGACDLSDYLNPALGGGFAPHKSAIHIVPGTNSNYIQFFNPVPAMTANGGTYGPFQRPAVRTFGDIERDAFFQPGLWNVDFSAAKRFALTERVGLQFTAQAFNVFNHVNPGGVSNQVDVPSGGRISSSASAPIGTSLRALQFAARVQF